MNDKMRLTKKIKELEALLKDAVTNQTFPGVEFWRVSAPFPRYEVSNWGRVRVAETKAQVKGYLHNSRAGVYRRFKLIDENKRMRQVFGHILTLSTFLGMKDKQVDHIDGNTLNNHLANLEYVSQSENIKRRNKLDKQLRGVK